MDKLANCIFFAKEVFSLLGALLSAESTIRLCSTKSLLSRKCNAMSEEEERGETGREGGEEGERGGVEGSWGRLRVRAVGGGERSGVRGEGMGGERGRVEGRAKSPNSVVVREIIINEK